MRKILFTFVSFDQRSPGTDHITSQATVSLTCCVVAMTEIVLRAIDDKIILNVTIFHKPNTLI